MADFTGTIGDDSYSGSAGDDNIFGAGGNDTLFGHDGNDLIDGGTGNDSLLGGNGDDVIFGGDGNDTLKGEAGNDYLVPGAGNDYIDGGTGSFDTADFSTSPSGVTVDLVACTASGDGNDLIFGVENIFGSLSNDVIVGNSSDNFFFGDDSNDSLSGADGSDNLEGDAGNDTLRGGNGDDYLVGGAGNDVIDGGADGSFGDTVDYSSASSFGVNVDLAAGVATDGLGGTDTLIGIENVVGSAFGDVLTGNTSVNFFEPGAGNDTLVGGGGKDVVSYEGASSGVTINLLTGVASGAAIGTDSLSGIQAAHGSGFGDTIILGNTVNAYTFGRGGNDSLVGGTGDDNFFGGSGNDTMVGGAGFDTISYTDDGFDTLDSTGNGVIVNLATGVATDNWGNTDTFSGIELVNGSAYADTLIGGNPLNGSGLTDGFEGFTGNGGNDYIDGGAGFDRVQYTTSPTGVFVTLGGNSNGTATDGFGGVDTLVNINEVRGSEFGDVLTGSSDNVFESFEGRGGNDTINGMGGTDRVNFQTSGSGVSVNLTSGTASDGFGGNDVLLNIENIRGSESSDSLTGDGNSNDIESRGGNDFIQGLLGEDFIRGGAGNDTIDGGVTTLVSNTASSNNEYDTANFNEATTGGVTVILGVDGTAGTAVGVDTGTDVLIGIERIYGTNFGDFISGTNRALNEIIRGGQGDDTLMGGASTGTDLGFNQVDYQSATGAVFVNIATGVASGADGNDVLSGFQGILSGLGNDVLTGNSADNFFYGGLGNDTIDGGAGNDRASYHTAPSAVTVNLVTGTSSGGGGNDTLISIENLRGSEHGDTLIGDSNSNDFQGREGNDTISAGAGEDTIYGGLGDDSMDGGSNDPLLGFDWLGYSTASGAVTVNLLTGTSSGAEGNDTFVNFEAVLGSSFGDSITGGNGDDVLRGNGGNDTIDGGAGIDWIDYSGASGSVTVSLVTQTSSGADGNDVFSNIERIRGGNSGDTLTGDAGDNRIRGNQGNDTIDGGAGNDAVDYRNATSGVTVRLDNGTSSGADGNDTLTNIEGIFGSYSYGDDLRGDGGANFIDGRGGDDTIDGGAGNDTLTGGAGNDTLDGGDGTDTAVFASNFADNVITVAPGDDDLFVVGPEGTDRLKHIEILQFNDRSFLIQQGGSGSDDLEGGAEGEMIRGRDGNDDVDGGGGDDALYGDDGLDTLAGGTGNDSLDGGTGADSMAGGTGDDTYIVDSLLDVVNETLPLGLLKDPLADNPGGGVDTVVSSVNYTLGNFVENLTLATGAGGLSGLGNALANILTGNASNNSLGGAAGNDTIDGSDGVDTATFSGNRSAYALGPLGQATTSVSSSAEGNDTLSHVERLLFADARVAIDTTGAAGHATQLTGAIFGGASIANGALVGQQLAQFDAGLTTDEVAAAALASPGFAAAAGSHSNTAFVNFVYQNVAGVLPDVGTLNLLVGALNSGLYTQASMALLAADYVGLGAVATNGLAYTLQEASVRVGGAGNDTLTGDANANTIFGREGNDVMNGAAGNDLIVGGAGLDRAVYSTTKAASSVAHNDLGLVVTTGTEVDQLEQVERITYSNISVAYDTSGNAGTVAKMIGAMFGIAALQDEALVGQYLAMLDAGTSYEGIVGAAAASTRFGTEAGSHSNAAFVDRVYFNIAGFHPDAATAAPLIAILDNATYTQAQLGVLAAEVDYNVGNVNLTGLAATGLEYTLTV